ncbi:hypothetical protein [Methanocaldococcus infernus]
MEEIIERIMRGEIKDEEVLEIYKEYLKVKDEVSYLEDLLDDLELLCRRFEEIKDSVKGLKYLIPKVSKYLNCKESVEETLRVLDNFEKLDLNHYYEVRARYFNELETLKKKLNQLEKKLKEAVNGRE